MTIPETVTVGDITFNVIHKTMSGDGRGDWQLIILRDLDKPKDNPVSWEDDCVLAWDGSNKSRWTSVRGDIRRKGVGTALRRLGVAINPELRYGAERSAAGEAFARAEGGPGANDPYVLLNW
jgi:hypothetical protein